MKRHLALAIPILLTAGCSRQKAEHVAGNTQQPTTVVQVATVELSPINDVYRASGTVRSRQAATIAARIEANVVEVRVHAGDRVQAGQTLVVLDDRDLEANVRRAEAARIQTESAVAETEDGITFARASTELARVTHKRIEGLLAAQSVSQQVFDESYARLQNAEATLEMAISKRRQAEARRRQSEAEIAAARLTLGYATLAAPFSGLITERKVEPGSLASPGTPLLTLEREGNLRLESSMDESRLNLARRGESVMVEIDGLSQNLTGLVGEITPSVDPTTRSFTAKIDLPDAPELRSGMFGRASFAAGKRETMLVPQSAISERGQIRCVHVVEGDTARLRFVTLGERRGDWREILSGLTPGERIVVSPPPLLADGSRVAIQAASK
jgi:multidrug efflux pump subunit AcrA (membrane-fusion protein)